MRVKRGFARRRSRGRILKQSEGFRGRRKSSFKLAERSLQKALKYAFRDRRAKKRDFRGIWIIRINAAARLNGLSYSRLIRGLKAAKVELDRKSLAELAVNHPTAFAAVAAQAKAALA